MNRVRGNPFIEFAALLLVVAPIASACVQVASPPTSPQVPNSTSAPSTAPPSTATPSTSASGGQPSPEAPPSEAADASPRPSTGSVVYIRDADLWLAAPDGSGARQLTSDGAAGGYHDPSQAPDGTIFVLRGANQLYRLDRGGQPVAQPVTLITLENGAEGLEVAPDGAHIAYVTTGFGSTVDPRFGTPTGTFIYGGTDIATPDGTSVPDAAMALMTYPSWADAQTIVVSDGIEVYVDRVGSDPESWIDRNDGCLTEFDCPPGDSAQSSLSTPAISPDGSIVAYVSSPYFGDAGREMAEVNGTPLAAPGAPCVITSQADFSDPGSFSADGSQFVFDDTRFDRTTFETVVGEGVFVMDVDTSSDDCGAGTARLIAPGGEQPDWGTLAP